MRLPKRWFWSYILAPLPNPLSKKKEWSACACRQAINPRTDTTIINDFFANNLFDEVFAVGRSRKVAEKRVIAQIKKGKYNTRIISNMNM